MIGNNHLSEDVYGEWITEALTLREKVLEQSKEIDNLKLELKKKDDKIKELEKSEADSAYMFDPDRGYKD